MTDLYHFLYINSGGYSGRDRMVDLQLLL